MAANGGGIGRLSGVSCDMRVDMAVFDRLPEPVRAMLRDLPASVSAASTLEAVRKYGVAPVLAAGRVFAEEIAAEHRRVTAEALSR